MSTRLRLVCWSLAFALLPLLVLAGLVCWQQKEVARAEAVERLQSIRHLKEESLASWSAAMQGDMATLLANGRGVLAAVREHGPEESLRAARDYLVNHVRFHSAIGEISILDATTGRIIVSTARQNEGLDRSNALSFTEPLRLKKLCVQDLSLSPTTRRRRMTVAAPLLGSGGKSPTAVVVADVDLETLDRLVQDRAGLGDTGETVLVNRELVALNDLRKVRDAALRLRIPAGPAVLSSLGGAGIVEGPDYHRTPVLAAYAFVPATRWGLVVKQDLAEVYAPVARLQTWLALLVASSLALVGILASTVGRSITRPILAMSTAADAFRKGDFAVRSHLKHDPAHELGVLAQSFDQLADHVQSQMSIEREGRRLLETLVQAGDLEVFFDEVLKALMEVTGSELGVFYRPDADRRLIPVVSMGVSREVLEPFDAGYREGALGAAVTSMRVCHIRDIPPDTRFTFRTLAGTAVPREMLSIPLVARERLFGVIALGSLRPYTPEATAVIERSLVALSLGLANLLGSEDNRRLANELSVKNAELEAQTVELRRQAEVLQDQNDELELQSAQLAEGSRLKSEFLSNMSHELRTPLNSVMALSRVLVMQSKGRLTDEESGYLSIIERNGRHLLSLINDLLDLAKIEAGKMEVVFTEFSLRERLSAVVESVQPLCEEKGLSMTCEVAREAERVTSDERRFHQIMQNLVGNAVKFTQKGGVTVRALRRLDDVVVVVEDTGIGIAPDELPHIFEEFRQVDGSPSRSFEGTGLGLAIALRSARLINGTLTAESTLGGGSTFTLAFPAGTPAVVTDGAPQAPGEPVPAGRKTLMLVEDSEPAIVQVKPALEDAGFVVVVARDGESALDLAWSELPDGIILDLMMPGVDGFEVLDRMRANPATAATPVLILTAKDLTADDLGRLRASHVQQLVQKGDVDREELLRKVERMLDRRSPGGEPSPIREVRVDETASPRPAGALPAVLVVEDNPDNLETVRAILAGRCDVLEAVDGREAVDVALARQPDLILMDQSLPGLDGLTVVRRLRQEPAMRRTPIIALTAHAMAGDREKALEAGCDDHVAKPIEVDSLRAAVERWLDAKREDKG